MGFNMLTIYHLSLHTVGSEEKLVGNFTFHQLALIIAGGSTIISYIVSFYLMWQHALNYTKPREQKQYALCLFYVYQPFELTCH